MPTDAIECPLCLGAGTLKRSEILDRLGVKDFARVAQLSAEEAIRLLLSKHQQDEQRGWARFETELAKRTAELAQNHRDELHALVTRTSELEGAQKIAEQQKAHEIEHANRRVEDSLREMATLRERNHELESEMAKVARVARKKNWISPRKPVLGRESGSVKNWLGMGILSLPTVIPLVRPLRPVCWWITRIKMQ
jgi:hypothetical protein